MGGRLEHGVSMAAAGDNAEVERESTANVLDGQIHRLHGTMEHTEGKVEAGAGRVFHWPEQEAKGFSKEVSTRGIEKAMGRLEEEDSKEDSHEAVQADAEYMNPRS